MFISYVDAQARKKKSNTQDNLLKSLPSLYLHRFLTGQKNPSSHSLSLPLLVPVISTMRHTFECTETSPRGRRRKKGRRIIEMAKELMSSEYISQLFSAVSSFTLCQTVITQSVRGEIYLKPTISTLREYDSETLILSSGTRG